MNMKKVGLTALAASLVSFSANAGEMTVSGAASISVGGYSAEKGNNPKIPKLSIIAKEIIKNNSLKVEGDPILLVYNSPYKVINRKNEILFRISQEDDFN